MSGRAALTAKADASRGRTYSIAELAEMTGFHRDTISDWLRRKENPPYESGGRQGVEYQIFLRHLIERQREHAGQEALRSPADGAFQFLGIKDSNKVIPARQRFISMGGTKAALIHRAPMQESLQRAFGIAGNLR